MAIKVKSNLDKSKFLKNLVNKDILTPHLEKATTKDFSWSYEYMPKEEDKGWHPSSHATLSTEALYDIATEQGEKKDWSSMHKTFQVGHFWHQYMQQLILRLGFASLEDIERKGDRTWDHIRYRDWHFATGSADVAPCAIPGHGDWVIDFKTMGNHDFKRNDLPDWCAEKYEAQMNLYMDMFVLDRALIVGIQKDAPHALKEFEFHRDDQQVELIYGKWERVSQWLSEQHQPSTLEFAEADKEFALTFQGPVIR